MISRETCIILTRGSPLARRQAALSAAALETGFAGRRIETRTLVTTGDRQQTWALEKTGGKGLFTSELENALLAHEGDLAVHSAKDLPTELPAGLVLAGFLPRADAADVLVRRASVPVPSVIATGSPRRRAQARTFFPDATFVELRGNVDTRLRKVAEGAADATFLAAAGLERLGITAWPELVFEKWSLDKMIPAAGQAAIAWQVRTEDAAGFAALCDAATGVAVSVERAFLARLGEGCQSAFAAHFRDGVVHLFHEDFGRRAVPFAVDGDGTDALAARVDGVLREIAAGAYR